jgi:hypothetical protein
MSLTPVIPHNGIYQVQPGDIARSGDVLMLIIASKEGVGGGANMWLLLADNKWHPWSVKTHTPSPAICVPLWESDWLVYRTLSE